MSDWIDVAPAAEFPSGEVRVVSTDGAPVAIFNVDGSYYAIEDVCTHDGGELASGWLDGDEIVCPRHGARFDVKTGAVKALPAVRPVKTFPVTVDGEEISVEVG